MTGRLEQQYSIKTTPKIEKELAQIAKKDKKLFAEIYQKMNYIKNGNFEQLDIRKIKREKGKFNILEIRIMGSHSYRIFYIHLNQETHSILLVDGRKKKVNAFKSKYFRELDNYIETYLNLLKGDEK